MVSGVSLFTCAPFSCVARLRLVHSYDMLHTKFIGCNQTCVCQVKLDKCVTHSFSSIPVTERLKGCRLYDCSNTNRQSTFMGWLVVTVVLGGNHYPRVRLWGNRHLMRRLRFPSGLFRAVISLSSCCVPSLALPCSFKFQLF